MKKRHTIVIDETLLEKCKEITGFKGTRDLGKVVEAGLANLVRREEVLKEYEALGGTLRYER